MSIPIMMSSRELRRVPANFLELCPRGKTWPGYLLPRELWPLPCPTCGPESRGSYGYDCGDGLTPEARAISQTFYPHMIGGDRARAEQLAWCDKLGQAEVDHLIEKGRLSVWSNWPGLPTVSNPRGHGRWINVPRTAAEINALNRRPGLDSHDGINRHYLVQFRCERLGIEMTCPTCAGCGTSWASPEVQAASEAWEPTEPPPGDHIVLWQTVSEGGPESEAFPDTEQGRRDLADWLAANDNSIHRDLSAVDWLRLFDDACPAVDPAGRLVSSASTEAHDG